MVSPSRSARSSSSFVQQYIVLSSDKEKLQHPCRCSPWEKFKWKHVAPRKAIVTNIRGVIPFSRSSTQAALVTCGARGENRAHKFLHLLLYSRPLGYSCGVARRCFLVPSYIPKSCSSGARIPSLSVLS